MDYEKVETAFEVKCLLGEGPAWDDVNGVLSWVDILKGQLYLQNLKDGTCKKVITGQYIGAAVPDGRGGYIGALAGGFYRLDGTGLVDKLGAPEGMSCRQRFNDAKCDPHGRLWAGTMSLYNDFDPPGLAALYLLNRDRTASVKVSGVTISNGLAWSADEKTMYYIDTPALAVSAFDFDAETGGISNRRDVIRFDKRGGSPDGMTIDSEGMLWVAMFNGGCVCRYDPGSGKCLRKIGVPTPYVTSCCFAGDDLGTLYITTARLERARDRNAGNVFSCRPGVRGTRTDFYQE
jgi:sugar lactone lactonase YvrE